MKYTEDDENGAQTGNPEYPGQMTLGAQAVWPRDADLIQYFAPLAGRARSEEIRRVLRLGLGIEPDAPEVDSAELSALRSQVETLSAALAALPGKLTQMQQPDGELWTELRALEDWRGYFDRALGELAERVNQIGTGATLAQSSDEHEADAGALDQRRNRLKGQGW